MDDTIWLVTSTTGLPSPRAAYRNKERAVQAVQETLRQYRLMYPNDLVTHIPAQDLWLVNFRLETSIQLEKVPFDAL
jgi:hypothetical protein